MRKNIASGLLMQPKVLLIMLSILALIVSNEAFSLFVLLMWFCKFLYKYMQFLVESGLLDD